MNCLQCGLTRVRWRKGKNRYFCNPCTLVRAKCSGRATASSLLQREIRAGRIRPAKEFQCVDCGVPAQAYDHRDYSKPLDVQPVCNGCNVRRGPGKWVNFAPMRELVKQARA